MSKKTIKMQMFVHRKADGTESVNEHDHTKNNTIQMWVELMGALVGVVDATITYESPPEVDVNQVLVEGLERAIDQERADSQVRVNLLLDRISQLKCLTHEPAQA